MVAHAKESDITVIESILFDAFNWMNSIGLPQWSLDSIKWSGLSKHFTIDDFYIAYSDNSPVACMALIDYDPVFWPDIEKGKSLFIHKLAVLRDYAGKGFSAELISFAKETARTMGVKTLRLDSRADRPKVRAVYEKNGFVCVKEEAVFGVHKTAFYVCNL